MVFVSMVGTQVLAVLNPLLAMLKHDTRINRIELFWTEHTKSVAARIQEFVKQHPEASQLPVASNQVSASLARNEKGIATAKEHIDNILARERAVAFNLAGGLGFQIASCAMGFAGKEECLFLYPESNGVHVIQLHKGLVKKHDRLPLPENLKVLQIQKIPFNIVAAQGPRKELIAALYPAEWKMQMPDQCYNIGGIVFDLVINAGNELRFLTSILDQFDPDPVQQVRELIALATGKSRFGELYHRDITLLTNVVKAAERAATESMGKIKVIYFDPRSHDRLEIHRQLRAFHGRMPELDAINKTDFIQDHTGKKSPSRAVLYTVLGQDPAASFIALFTHRPKKVVFLYTPQDPVVVGYVRAIRENKALLPISGVSFYPVSLLGNEVFDIKPNEDHLEINITPGTKAQKTFLSLWGGLHNAKVYSIKTGEMHLKGINTADGPRIDAPAPVDYLKLTGIRLRDRGQGLRDLQPSREQFAGVLRFLGLLSKEKRSIGQFPLKNIKLDGARYFHGRSSREGWQFSLEFGQEPQGPIKGFMMAKGRWFEQLVGFAMGACGVDDVQVRIRTAWRQGLQQSFERALQRKGGWSNPDENVFKTDMDVVAKFGGSYYVVSCKSGFIENGKIARYAAEVEAVARLFGRFAVPLLCLLKYEGEGYKTDQNVYLFGYKTLADSARMKALLQEAIGESRTTGLE